MGVYLAPELVREGFLVDITSRGERISDDEAINYIQGDALSEDFLLSITNDANYDLIVDFMIYSTEDFKKRHKRILDSCKHYIYLSSYRVFADSEVLTEKSPRLLDVSQDDAFLRTDDYALEKARQEDILRLGRKKNWTIVRPSITYSKDRFQLGTLEADTVIWRSLNNKPVILPKELLEKQTTMTWAGDVAKMIAKLALNKDSYGEDYNVVTAEHYTWRDVAGIYSDVIGLRYVPVSIKDYVSALGGGHVEYQVKYDRMFNRIMDNTKILKATGLKQGNLMTLEDGLRKELTRFTEGGEGCGLIDPERQHRIDALTDSWLITIRKRLRLRTRSIALLKRLKYTTRIRTRLRQIKKNLQTELHRLKYHTADGAIITLPGYYNYGNMVQRFALQEFLRKAGYRFVSYAKDTLPEGEELGRLRYTYDFVERNIWRKQYDPRDKFKTYIVGSDQVWRKWGYDDIFDELPYYFLEFTKDWDVKRIAYAASIGQDSLKAADYTDEFIPYAGQLVRKFDCVSMRESSGVEIVEKEWGAKAVQVIDPTLLLEADDYDKLIDAAPYEIKQVSSMFTYFILTDEPKRALIAKIAQDAGLKDEGIYLESKDALRPVEEWLAGIRDAQLVVVDSFHGMVFSIIYHTPFVVLESGTGGASRITLLLGQLGLEDRYVTSDKAASFVVTDLPRIDWNEVDDKLMALRETSSKWLLDAILEPRR